MKTIYSDCIEDAIQYGTKSCYMYEPLTDMGKEFPRKNYTQLARRYALEIALHRVKTLGGIKGINKEDESLGLEPLTNFRHLIREIESKEITLVLRRP